MTSDTSSCSRPKKSTSITSSRADVFSQQVLAINSTVTWCNVTLPNLAFSIHHVCKRFTLFLSTVRD